MGIATGVLVGAGISAAAGLGGAAIQSNAAGKAADTQAAAANEATRLQRDIYNQQRQDTMPWLRAGQGAVNTLGNLMGIPMGGGATGPQPMQQPPGFQPRTPTANAQPTGMVARPRAGTLADVGQVTGGMVNMRGPDGSVRQVPSFQVDYYTQKGAQRF